MWWKWIISALIVVAFSSTASAQVTVGDASMNLSGSVAAGYSGSFGNQSSSSHGIGFGGTGDLSGYYHSAQFISFDVSPFYNQSRNDSSSQSITDATGVTATATIFGGSRYPGHLTYSDVYNSEGEYLLPGITNYKTNGDAQSFGVGWTGRPTEALSFSTGYEYGANSSSVYGASNGINAHYYSLYAISSYSLAGFRLGGGIHYGNQSYTSPEILTGETAPASQASTTTYNFSLSHTLPLDGSASLNFSRNTTGFNALGTEDSQTSDIVTVGVSVKPMNKLSTSFSGDYDDNLAGTLFQAANHAGAIVPLSLPGEKSHSWGVYGDAQYTIGEHFYLTGDVTHRQQLFLGSSYGSTTYSGGVNYGRELAGGQLTAGTIVNESTLGNLGGSRLGFLSNASYIRQIGAWNMSSSFGYSHDSESLLVAYTTSGYSYSTAVTRRLGKLNWNGSASGSKSLMSQIEGTTSFTQSYSTGLSHRLLGVSAGYSRSSGLGLYTAQGIGTLPSGLPPTLLSSTLRYGGTSYSIGVGSSPIRGLTFNGTFADTRSNTENGTLSSSNKSQEAYMYLQYKFRKMFLTAGYSRLVQGFSASNLAPSMVTTYYVGISRWFNFF